MNILNLYPATTTTGVSSLTSATASASTPPSASSGGATASISTPAQLFSELQQLSQRNPAQFKAIAAQLATSFQSAASQATGTDAKVLNSLANQFTQAAQTGQLQPPAGPQGGTQGVGATGQSGSAGHHHHHHGGGAVGSSAIQQAFASASSLVEQALQGTDTATLPAGWPIGATAT